MNPEATSQTPPATPRTKTAPLATTSLVLGILGLLCFSILTAIPAVICGHLARSRIKQSAGSLTGNGLALGGLITGYIGCALALLMIPLMLAVAIPSFVKARDTATMHVCLNNLHMIEAAKQRWALEHKKETTDTPTLNDLSTYLRDGQMPVCPAGGAYVIGSVGQLATCSNSKHAQPPP